MSKTQFPFADDANVYDPLVDGASLNQATLDAALTSIGSTDYVLLVSRVDRTGAAGNWAVTSNTTIPSNVTLWIPQGAKFNISVGITLTISGDIWAGKYQIFTGTGSVAFGADCPLPSVDPVWWGAIGDGDDTNAAANTTAWQAAIDTLQASATGRVKVLEFSGTHVFDSEVTFKDHSAEFTRFPITIRGVRGNREGAGATIKAKAGYTDAQLLRFVDTSDPTGTNAYYDFENFKLDGNSIANLHGVTCVSMTGMSWVDVGAENFTGTGYVYNATSTQVTIAFDRCHFISNGDRVISMTGSATNDVSFHQCEFSTTSGWALYLHNATKLSVVECTIQSCAKGAFFLDSARGVTITGNRFETNGSTGVTPTTPATSVIKSDIWLNGDAGTGDENTFDNTTPCERVRISENIFTNASTTGHVNLIAVDGCIIENNLVPAEDVFWSWGKTDITHVGNLVMKNNENAGGVVEISVEEQQVISFGSAFATDNALNAQMTHTFDFELDVLNLIQPSQRFYSWGVIAAAGGSTFIRVSGMTYATPVFRLTNNGSTSDVVGITIDLDDDLGFVRGKWVYFGIYASLSTTTDNNIGLYTAVSGGSGTSAGHSTASTTGAQTARRFYSMAQLIASDDTSLNIGIRKLGTGSGSIDVSLPILAVIGSHYKRMPGEPPNVHWGAATPAAGTWSTGDIVWFTGATAGNPPGAYCVTGGTPGTWKDMANLAA